MYVQPSSPQSIGGVIDDGIRLFRSSFSRCWLLAIIPGLVLAVYETFYPISVPLYSALGHPSAFMALAQSPRLVVMDIVSGLLGLIFQGAVVVRELAILRGEESCTFAGAIGTGLRRLPGMVLATILFALAIAGGCIALLIPGLWLWARLQLWTAALFAEDASATEALASSWRLTRGHWWRAATIFSVAVIIMIVLALVFTFVGGVFAALSQASTLGRTVLLYVFSLASRAIYYPLGAAIWLAMYHDFKLRLEGGDLVTRVGALDGAA
ncbi:MAG: hypothetical protein ACRETB_06455 [Steroidobacteraceae bacterium]